MICWYVKFRINPFLVLSRYVYAYSYNEAVAKARRLITGTTFNDVTIMLCQPLEEAEDINNT